MTSTSTSSVKADDTIQHCIDIILKEAREETRLVKQITYTFLSMYTNNPLNLAINAPSGEGKNYVIKKVGELFPANDIIFLAGLSEKALYHRHGILVVKDPVTGKYESIEDKLKEIDEQIEDKEIEIFNANNNSTLKQSLKHDIRDLQKEKKDLTKDARNLIDLSHKTLVLLDTPSRGLFGALMSLLSHDQYEAEYEFADTTNTGISTKVNILRGWPAVIFAQAVDYSNYSRWSEVQRRFIITNPNMDPTKYNAALDLMADKFGLPDTVYQTKVVSDEEKEAARSLIEEFKQGILEITHRSERPDKNNVIIPFIHAVNKSLTRHKASDMTMAYRLFSFMNLLPQINFYHRPYLQVVDPSRNILFIQQIPFATFEDLREAIYLMEYADGVRPYVLKWYHEVFLPTFNAKTELDSRFNSKGQKLEEKKIAVTTEQLSKATEAIQQKIMSKQQIRENYVEPLMNQGYIDSIDSELDKRSDIYYPVIMKIDKLNGMGDPCNFSQETKISVTDPTIFPNETYLNTLILDVINKTEQKGFKTKIISHDHQDKDEKEKGKELTVEELVNLYYPKPENIFQNNTSESVYLQTGKNRDQSQPSAEEDKKSIKSDEEPSKKLDGMTDPSNLSICDKCGEHLPQDQGDFWNDVHSRNCNGKKD